MDKKQTNAQVEAFLRKDSQWQSAYQYLRTLIFNETELEEQYKWMHPCYTLNNKNVVLIHGFKHYVALLFHKGALLEDQYGTLVQQTEKVQAARQLRFTSLKEIEQRRDEILYYVKQAIQVEQQGKTVTLKETADYEMPEELASKFDEMPELKTAFESLTPGRQRQYMYYIGQAKRSQTRHNRVEKYVNLILDGTGMMD